MNEEKKLILENQQVIMNSVNLIMVNTTTGSGDIQRQIIESYEKTKSFLNPEVEPTIQEQTKQALSDDVKRDDGE